MRRLFPLAIGIALLTTLSQSAFAQSADDYYEDEPRRQIPTAGFWPTQTMLDRMIDRMTEGMAEHYQFDEDQEYQANTLIKDRFPNWLSDNRAEIQDLMNQYFEALLNDEPPAPEDVAVWAQRVLPLMEDFEQQAIGLTDDMRPFMTEDQLLQLDSEIAAFRTGMTMAKNRVGVWSEGGYDPETEWIRSPEARERAREERRARREAIRAARERAEAGESPDVAAAAALAEAEQREAARAAEREQDEWTKYTLAMIKRYEFNDEQRQKAMTVLRRQQQQRDRYLKRRADDIQRVTTQLEQAQGDEDREQALAAYNKVNEPVERMFQQLKDQLDRLPTRAQRRAAAERIMDDQPTTAPASRAAGG